MTDKDRASAYGTGLSSASPTAPEVAAVPVSIPDAWPLCGYAPGNYMGRCRDCGAEWWDGDKRASQCLQCAVRTANRLIAEGQRLQQAAQLFREYVIRNTEGLSHHHPIWVMLAELLPSADIRSGADWRFILPDNRLTLEECHAQGMSAGTAKTAQPVEGEARQPDPKDAPKARCNPSQHTPENHHDR